MAGLADALAGRLRHGRRQTLKAVPSGDTGTDPAFRAARSRTTAKSPKLKRLKRGPQDEAMTRGPSGGAIAIAATSPSCRYFVPLFTRIATLLPTNRRSRGRSIIAAASVWTYQLRAATELSTYRAGRELLERLAEVGAGGGRRRASRKRSPTTRYQSLRSQWRPRSHHRASRRAEGCRLFAAAQSAGPGFGRLATRRHGDLVPSPRQTHRSRSSGAQAES